ncbi:hypothetical protein ACIQRS_31245 [Streptomyces termitum]|uniref:Uncharacterized protein n=1 Tax=Streptomyces termitum TaxID=67368 RepID=A0A918WBV5_9ACTN|nr:hypothetical protein [Streptomyces termitum]GHB11454.1 hypothetical protein GCM10010305_62770 [Streptomyces termitum]
MRLLESLAPEEARALRVTLCGYDHREAGQALLAAIALCRRWSAAAEAPVERRRHAEELAVRYLLDVVEGSIGRSTGADG